MSTKRKPAAAQISSSSSTTKKKRGKNANKPTETSVPTENEIARMPPFDEKCRELGKFCKNSTRAFFVFEARETQVCLLPTHWNSELKMFYGYYFGNSDYGEAHWNRFDFDEFETLGGGKGEWIRRVDLEKKHSSMFVNQIIEKMQSQWKKEWEKEHGTTSR